MKAPPLFTAKTIPYSSFPAETSGENRRKGDKGYELWTLRPEFRRLLLVGLLTVVGKPSARAKIEVIKACRERRVLGRARINAHLDRAAAFMQVAHAHLMPHLAVLGAVDAIVIVATTEAIPHLALVGGNLGGCPVGPTMVGDDATQMLNDTILVLN